uniref:Uncharacterized protein n=1 Tax=Salix viminalis TaxID=40686 RepID=A0A6N2MJD4_SALVM
MCSFCILKSFSGICGQMVYYAHGKIVEEMGGEWAFCISIQLIFCVEIYSLPVCLFDRFATFCLEHGELKLQAYLRGLLKLPERLVSC